MLKHIPHHLQLRARLYSIDARHIQRDNVHRPYAFGTEALESGGSERVPAGGEHDVVRRGCELADQF